MLSHQRTPNRNTRVNSWGTGVWGDDAPAIGEEATPANDPSTLNAAKRSMLCRFVDRHFWLKYVALVVVLISIAMITWVVAVKLRRVEIKFSKEPEDFSMLGRRSMKLAR